MQYKRVEQAVKLLGCCCRSTRCCCRYGGFCDAISHVIRAAIVQNDTAIVASTGVANVPFCVAANGCTRCLRTSRSCGCHPCCCRSGSCARYDALRHVVRATIVQDNTAIVTPTGMASVPFCVAANGAAFSDEDPVCSFFFIGRSDCDLLVPGAQIGTKHVHVRPVWRLHLAMCRVHKFWIAWILNGCCACRARDSCAGGCCSGRDGSRCQRRC